MKGPPLLSVIILVWLHLGFLSSHERKPKTLELQCLEDVKTSDILLLTYSMQGPAGAVTAEKARMEIQGRGRASPPVLWAAVSFSFPAQWPQEANSK